MDQSTTQMNPDILHSLVNSIKKKKVGVKKRFQASMDNFVNEIFDDMVEEMQEMMPKNPSSTIALQTNSTFKPKPFQVKKVAPKNEHKFAKLPSTSKLATKYIKPTPKMLAVKSASQPVGSVGQKRTVKSAGADANDNSSMAINESFDEMKDNSQVDDCSNNIIEINKELIKIQVTICKCFIMNII